MKLVVKGVRNLENVLAVTAAYRTKARFDAEILTDVAMDRAEGAALEF